VGVELGEGVGVGIGRGGGKSSNGKALRRKTWFPPRGILTGIVEPDWRS
jgi:hypothetical protein